MQKITVTNHAVERYKERATGDTMRKNRDANSIRKIIIDAIIASSNWAPLEELMSGGIRKEYELSIKLFDGWDFIGTNKAVLTPTDKKKNYTVVTFI